MPDIGQITAFLTGLGAGSVVTVLVKYWVDRRTKRDDARFTAVKEATDGFLDSYRALAEGWSDEKAKKFAYWEAKLQLICSPSLLDAIRRLKEATPGSTDRSVAHEDVIKGLRAELDLAGRAK